MTAATVTAAAVLEAEAADTAPGADRATAAHSFPAPDTSTFSLLHQAMRADSARLARAVAQLEEGRRASTGAALVRWYRGFREELLAHHHVEDEIFMPALLERMPALAGELTRIDADHHVLDDVLERVRVGLDALADPAASWWVCHAATADATRELHELLRRHLDFEDGEIVPRFAEHFTAEAYEALDQQARKKMRLGVLAFTLPWIMDNVDKAQKGELLAGAPFAFKLVWYATRRRYARLVAAAFGA